MQICIKVFQSREVFDALNSSFSADGWATRFFRAHGITTRLAFSAGELVPEDLLCFPDALRVVVAEARDPGGLGRLASMTLRVSGLIKENDNIPLMVAPFIAVFKAGALSAPHYELPEFVSAWVMDRADPVELTHRILGVLRAGKLRKVYLACGELVVVPESRMLTYKNASVRLSPAEFALAELFFSRIGSVISLNELSGFFKSAGKSTEPNNIRVTIHQLRLKLEELTKARLQLCTIYRKGYCLRQSHRGAQEGSEADTGLEEKLISSS